MAVAEDYFIIDWVNAKIGNPVLDIARSYVILKQYAKRLANKYLKLIIAQSDFTMADIEIAIPVMATLRLLEIDSAAEKELLLELIK